jgi:hypothetical protein
MSGRLHLVIAIVRSSSRGAAGFKVVQEWLRRTKDWRKTTSPAWAPGRLTSADDEIRDGWKMTYITSEDLADLDDTIEDEMQVDAFARAAAREASAMLLELLVTHHGRRAPRS